MHAIHNQTQPEESSTNTSGAPLLSCLEQIGPTIAKNGEQADQSDRFPAENYQLLRQHRLFSALVPEELGGQGCNFSEMCRFIQELATYHPSTALSFSMHQHIIATNRYNYTHGRPGQAVLEKVAANELVLVSTGAGDWLASNGTMTKVDGGYRVNAMKHFASGSPSGNILVTSAPYEDPEAGWQVLHFPLPLNAEGVSVLDNWAPLGMRGTGSNSVKIADAFVPEEAVVVKRPRGDFHMIWSVVLPVALPLIMSVYHGIARSAAQKAREITAGSTDPVTPTLLGEMENALTTIQIAVEDMVRISDNFNYSADLETVNEMVKRKTMAAAACKETTAKALEASGGLGFMRSTGIESLFRDSMAAHFHPLQEKRQLLFTGSLAMGKEPPKQAF